MAYRYSFDHYGVKPNLRLLCEEDTDSCFDAFSDNNNIDDDDDDYDDSGQGHNRSPDSESGFSLFLQSEEVVRTMVDREKDHLPRSDYLNRLRSGHLDLSFRRQALDWIFKAHSHYSFGAMCICLATNYLDRFLSVYELPRDKAWTVQLVAVACLSLAAKMDETNVPQLVNLQVGEPKFVFEAKTIQRMEFLVLSKLNWRMKAVTACSFIDHFLGKIIDDHRLLPSMSSIFRSSHLILATIRGIDFLEFRPSEIAAAVAISVSVEIKAVVDMNKAIFSIKHVEKGRVLKCVEMMRDMSLISWCTKANGTSVSASSLPRSPIGVLEAAIFSYNLNNNPNANSNTSTTMSSNSITTTPTNKKRKRHTFYLI